MSNPFEMGAACPTEMTVRRAGEDLASAPEGVATGPFLVQMLLSSRAEDEMTAMRAYVAPGIATDRHSHPRGQLLFVLDGVGLAQRDGGEVVEICAVDSVWFAPGERHWHGAAASPFSYISVQQVQGGTAALWMEPVERPETHP